MAVKQILTQTDEFSILRKPTVPVDVFGLALRALADDMWDSMYAARGVGLAATQIGSNLRVAVIDTIQRENSYRRLVMVNPRILESSGEQIAEEGCLSMPGLGWPIPRAESVRVEFWDVEGKRQVMNARALFARAIQHECDHLDGILCNARAVEASSL